MSNPTLGIGVNENVVLSKVEITEADKGTTAFTFRPVVVKTDVPELSDFEKLSQDGYTDIDTSQELTLRLFAPLPPFAEGKDGKAVPLETQQERAGNSIAELKNVFFQILTTYMTADKAKFTDMWRNTGIDKAGSNFGEMIIRKETLNRVMANMAEDFVGLITPYLDKDEHAIRIIFVRQSPLKHYADFRQRYVREHPFIESMKIPKAASKIAFSKSEIAKKLNSAEVTSISEADKAAEASESQTAADIFGQQSESEYAAETALAATPVDDLPF